ncbi:MAG: post-PEP-CTERM-1 domain-containing protein [Candidatus Binatia bacterium]
MVRWQRQVLATSLVLGGLCVLGGDVAVHTAQPNAHATAKTKASQKADGVVIRRGAAGQRIYVDPETGRMGAPPPGRSLSAVVSLDPAMSTSDQGLLEVPAPGGGMMVDLQGRFRSAAVARVKPDGSVVTECLPARMRVPKH